MFVRNFLSAGDYLEIVPIGLPLTLQYDVHGGLEKVLFKYENDSVDVTETLRPVLLNNKLVPRRIPLKNGTSWILGVMYTQDNPSSVGNIPDDLKEEYIIHLSEHPERFKFYAGSVSSMASVFHGAVPIRQWLSLSGFNLLPGYVIPAELAEYNFDKLVTSRNFPFEYPLFQGYLIFKRSDVKYYDLGFKQDKVKGSEIVVSDEGYLKVTLSLTKRPDMIVDYSEYVRMNLQSGVIILLDESDKILYSVDPDDQRNSLLKVNGSSVTCPVCGKVYSFSYNQPVICTDEHCNSRLYPRVNQLLSTFGLPEISKDRYDKIILNVGSIFSVPDILDEYGYKSKKISTTLSRLLRAIVPQSVIGKFDAFDSFCNRCNNSVDSVKYYIDNPDKANQDLKLYECNTSYVNFLKWLSNKENAMDIHSLLMNENIEITDSNKTLPNVAPIFRGTKICITGRFRHGPESKIVSILGSYGAEVVTRYSDDVSFVVVGDTKEGVNGPVTRSAKQDNKTIYDESDFFKQFEIDQDLAENL